MAYQETPIGVGTTTQVVVGLFKNANDAHTAVTQLRANGFTSEQIGAAFRDETASFSGDRSLATDDAMAPHESWWEKVKDAFSPQDDRTTSTAAATTDTTGYSRSDYEYDFAGDDFEGSLAAAGIPAHRAAYLTRSLEPGGAIVTVRDAVRTEEAERILADNNARARYEDAEDTNVTGSFTDVGDRNVASAGLPGPIAVGAAATDVDPLVSTGTGPVDIGRGMDRVQLFGEVLRVHKERITRGEVRVHKDVITENQSIEVPVTREEFVLERVPVSGTTPASSASIGRDQEVRVPLSEETVRVEKEPVLREEVIVGKRQVSDVATLSEDVRHEELRVDTDGDISRRAVAGEDLTAEDVRRRG